MASTSDALRMTFSGRAVRRSAIVTLVIGTLLNAINQGPELLAGHGPVYWKLLLTYAVPFCVASYGSYAAFRSQ
jgi:hypothetical protein